MRNFCFILLACLFLSCDGDPIEEGVETTIEGRIYDERNDIPFEDLKIKIAEYKIHRSGIYQNREFIQWIDSTYTDQNGDFFIAFKTSGRGDYYEFHAETGTDIWDYYQSVFQIPYIGKSLSMELDLLHLYPVRLVVALNEVEHLPLKIRPQFYQKVEEIKTGSGTAERIIYTDKNSETTVYFSRNPEPNVYEGYTAKIPASNSMELTDFNLTINNSDFQPRE